VIFKFIKNLSLQKKGTFSHHQFYIQIIEYRTLITCEWIKKKGTDSVRLWRDKDNYSEINIDFAPIVSFEAFMKNEQIPFSDEQFDNEILIDYSLN
jgi:hypothetical protein